MNAKSYINYDWYGQPTAMKILDYIASKNGYDGVVTTQSGIANAIGVRRETVCANLKILAKSGVIAVRTTNKYTLIFLVGKRRNASAAYSDGDLELFRKFYGGYPGVKRDAATEFAYFAKITADWRTVLPLLPGALADMLKCRKIITEQGGFLPNLPHLRNWLKNRQWENDYKITIKKDSDDLFKGLDIFGKRQDGKGKIS